MCITFFILHLNVHQYTCSRGGRYTGFPRSRNNTVQVDLRTPNTGSGNLIHLEANITVSMQYTISRICQHLGQ